MGERTREPSAQLVIRVGSTHTRCAHPLVCHPLSPSLVLVPGAGVQAPFLFLFPPLALALRLAPPASYRAQLHICHTRLPHRAYPPADANGPTWDRAHSGTGVQPKQPRGARPRDGPHAHPIHPRNLVPSISRIPPSNKHTGTGTQDPHPSRKHQSQPHRAHVQGQDKGFPPETPKDSHSSQPALARIPNACLSALYTPNTPPSHWSAGPYL